MSKKITLTKAGRDELQKELDNLILVERVKVKADLNEARSHGDLSENSEYDAAKDKQGQIEARIEEIQQILKIAEVIDDDDISTDKVGIGVCVKILDKELNEEMEFTIVGINEADFDKGKLSDESPIGKGLIGHSAGEVVDIETPSGVLSFEILSITKKDSNDAEDKKNEEG